MLPTGFRTFHFVSFLCVFSFSFLFFCFVSFLTILFSFFCVSFFCVSFRYFSPCFLFVFFFPFLFVSFRFIPFLSLQVPRILYMPSHTVCVEKTKTQWAGYDEMNFLYTLNIQFMGNSMCKKKKMAQTRLPGLFPLNWGTLAPATPLWCRVSVLVWNLVVSWTMSLHFRLW